MGLGLQAWWLGHARARAAPWRLRMGPGERDAQQHASEWCAELRSGGGCGDWRSWAGSAPDLFPPERDPSCSNLSTALRDVPSLSPKPASLLMLGRLVKKAWPQSSEWRSSERLGKPITSYTCVHSISAGPHWEPERTDEPEKALRSLARSISTTILLCSPRQSRNPGDPGNSTLLCLVCLPNSKIARE